MRKPWKKRTRGSEKGHEEPFQSPAEVTEEEQTRGKYRICTIEEKVDQNDNAIPKHNAIISTKSTISADSEIDLISLAKPIDDRIEDKLWDRGNSEIGVVKTVYANDTESTNQISSSSSDTRKLNIIVHGIQEENAVNDKTATEDLFDTVGIKLT